LFIVAITLASVLIILREPLRLGFDLRGGTSLILRVRVEDASPAQPHEVVEQTRQVLEHRINAFGLSEAQAQPYGSRGNELLVQFPGITDSSWIRNLLQSRGVLEWYSVEEGPYASAEDALVQYGGIVPLNRKLLATKPAPDRVRIWFLLDRHPIVRGTDLRDARSATDSRTNPLRLSP